ncbi:MAG: FecR domain-containing protein [Pirellulales bacterium]|nr:FecR domain-containing protein [Pirellulales bacterium]
MSSPTPPLDSTELRRLIEALHDETITPEEKARLAERLLHDEAARELYVQYMYLYARLRWDRRCEPEPSSPLPNGQPTQARSPILGHLGSVLQTGIEFLSRPLVLTIAVAVGLPGLILLILAVGLPRHPIENPRAVGTVAVARITKILRPVWESEDVPLSIGTTLASGQSVHLLEGLSEIEFANGASVILEGPVLFEARGRNAGFLHKGSVVATAGPAAKGFSIHTPLATIVDLGTEFGVKVADGQAEAHVFQGEVEIESDRDGAGAVRPLRRIHAGHATQIQLAGNGKTIQTKDVASTPDRFVRRVPPESNAGLPEPRIVFSHRGDRDPTTEGWSFLWEPKTSPRLEGVDMKPVTENGVAAWSIDDRTTKMGVTYRVIEAQGLNPTLIDTARSRGWVIRARIKVTADWKPVRGESFLSYWDGRRAWRLHPTVNAQGDQALFVFASSSLGEGVTIDIPNSRDRFVDYELRYHPETDDADLYIDGRLAATKVFAEQKSRVSFHFGTIDKTKSHPRFAQVEWGILDATPQQGTESEKQGNNSEDPS